MDEKKVIISEGLFNKITTILFELPYKNVGPVVDQIKQELSAQAQAPQEAPVVEEVKK